MSEQLRVIIDDILFTHESPVHIEINETESEIDWQLYWQSMRDDLTTLRDLLPSATHCAESERLIDAVRMEWLNNQLDAWQDTSMSDERQWRTWPLTEQTVDTLKAMRDVLTQP